MEAPKPGYPMYIPLNASRSVRADAITSVRTGDKSFNITLDESAPYLHGDKKSYASLYVVKDEPFKAGVKAWLATQQQSGAVVALTADLYVVRSKVMVLTKDDATRRLTLRCRGGGAIDLKPTARKPVAYARPYEQIVAALLGG